MLPDSRKVKEYWVNLRLRVSKKDLLWLLLLVLPGGFLLMIVLLLATKKLRTKWSKADDKRSDDHGQK